MYRLLIIDDEPIIADGLYDMFHEQSKLELDIFKAYSGMEAMDLLNRYKIDIVLSDIHMPGMNGLQLLEEIDKNWPLCRVIFLTGYTQFEYAYKAMQYEKVNYLLKTESFDKIYETVEKTVSDIEKSLRMEELVSNAYESNSVIMGLYRKEYLLAMLKGENLQLAQKELDDLGISMEITKPVFLVAGRIDNMPETVSYQERQSCYNAVGNICIKFFSSNTNSLFVRDTMNNIICFLQPAEIGNMEGCKEDIAQYYKKTSVFVGGMLETIQGVCRESLNLIASFVFTGKATLWTNIPAEYYELKKMLDFRIGDGVEMLMTNTSLVNNESYLGFNTVDLLQQTVQKLARTDLLSACLERGQKNEFFKFLKQYTECLKETKSKNSTIAMQIFYTLSIIFLSYINRWNLNEKLAFRIGLYKLTQTDEYRTWEEAAKYFEELAEILFDMQNHDQEKRTEYAIAGVKHYISTHLGEDLSLVRLSETVHFNPSYLSRLFRQVTGENISEYIMVLRMNKARELLEDSGNKIYEVSIAVGYESATNFGRVFKKNAGMTPQEYRDYFLSGK